MSEFDQLLQGLFPKIAFSSLALVLLLLFNIYWSAGSFSSDDIYGISALNTEIIYSDGLTDFGLY